MSNGRVHTTVSLVVAVPAFFVSLKLGMNPVATLIGSLLGVIMTPDLDVNRKGRISVNTYGEQVLWRMNRPLGRAYQLYWEPYARIVRHRSIISHLPILGTGIRLAYLLWPVFLVVWYLVSRFGWEMPGYLPVWFRSAIFGLAVADFFHWALDGFPVTKGR